VFTRQVYDDSPDSQFEAIAINVRVAAPLTHARRTAQMCAKDSAPPSITNGVPLTSTILTAADTLTRFQPE
jgi:hypothetical protein